MAQCSQCVYFTRPGKPDDRYGVCVRFPQPANKHAEDWCGEFKAASAETRLKEPKDRPRGA